MRKEELKSFIATVFCFLSISIQAKTEGIGPVVQTPALPSAAELNRSFGSEDRENFKSPPKVYYPETWFHFIGGNVSKAGIKSDLEAIKAAGISGIQLFHGQFGGAWPGVSPQITCLSPLWADAVKYTAEECRRLGLRFCMQNCPGWAMSGGPWITPRNAMRNLVWSRTDVEVKNEADTILSKPQPSDESWRDYQEVCVLAFPTSSGDTGKFLQPTEVKGNGALDWQACLAGSLKSPLKLAPRSEKDPYRVEVSFPVGTVVRTIELPSIDGMNPLWCYDPGISFKVEAVMQDGETETIVQMDIPESNWEDNSPFSIACSEMKGANKYRISLWNKHETDLSWIHFYSAARENSWESAAGWTLRKIERRAEHPVQSPEAYLQGGEVYDLSSSMDSTGAIKWTVPKEGKWTILRIGHVNIGMRNGPAPAEGTGWECDKLSDGGPAVHFAGYIGRLADGPLKGGLLNGMVMDSWECGTQTWTKDMEAEFSEKDGYPLRKWLPAVMGFVIGDPETTARFLLDWKRTIGDLFANKFYGGMTKLAKEKGLTIQYETAAGDIFPADIMEYYKYADIPMCEFWQPMSEGFVGSLNFKPIKPTASAAHLYGKPRVAAESFTSFDLTWDEHWEMLKEVANVNYIEGVTHSIFHTYTHNPRTDFLPPGTSFGAGIGTPFLRGETWWRHMPAFTSYLARCSYLLERGKPVSDVLWYLGDEINHKPDQEAAFPEGIKYDYCNPDVLLHRLKVKNGRLETPERVSYKVLWLVDNARMFPETLEKLYVLLREGATVVGNAPKGLATLKGGEDSQRRFDAAVHAIWKNGDQAGIWSVGKGKVLVGMDLGAALRALNLKADVKGGNALWLHRKVNGADWYYVCAPKGSGFHGTLDFHCKGKVEMWDPLTGEVSAEESEKKGEYTSVPLDLSHAGCCFIVFRHGRKDDSIPKIEKPVLQNRMILDKGWTLSFPSGWGAPDTLRLKELKAWKDLDLTAEGKAFSGTASYTTSFEIDKAKAGMPCILDLGRVEMIAVVTVNGKELRTLWTSPYRLDIGRALREEKNELKVEVTSTWYNRLVYDAGLPEAERKTWTISGPTKDSPLRESGLLGPVVLKY